MAKTLRAWRTERLLSTRRLADLAGSSNKTIVQLENGRQTATFTTIEKLSRVLRVEPRDVIEFARAIDVRAGLVSDEPPIAQPAAQRQLHVYCVGAAEIFHPLASKLLESGRYCFTLVAGVPQTPEQISCARPDVVVLDVDDAAARVLLHGLLDDRGPNATPVVVTSSDPDSLVALASTLEQSAAQGVTFVPRAENLDDVVSAVESCLTPA
jgi:transcriptional regulator with XRE-family HTH domain